MHVECRSTSSAVTVPPRRRVAVRYGLTIADLSECLPGTTGHAIFSGRNTTAPVRSGRGGSSFRSPGRTVGAVAASSRRSHARLGHYGILQCGCTVQRNTEQAQESAVPSWFRNYARMSSRIADPSQWRSNSGSCRMLYVTERELFATAISRHASAAALASQPGPVRAGGVRHDSSPGRSDRSGSSYGSRLARHGRAKL